MANKMTYAVAIDVMLAIADGKEVEDAVKVEAVARMADLKAQLAKRNGSGKKGLTKAQKEGVDLKAHIAEILATEPDGVTATEVGNAIGQTCQRASALLKQMIENGDAHKVKDGRVVRFFAGPAEDAEVAEGE